MMSGGVIWTDRSPHHPALALALALALTMVPIEPYWCSRYHNVLPSVLYLVLLLSSLEDLLLHISNV